jgi:hypothetical protein
MGLFSLLAPVASVGGYALGGPVGGYIGGALGGALAANEQAKERAAKDRAAKLLEAEQSRYSWARQNGKGFVREAPETNYNDAATIGAGGFAGFKDALAYQLAKKKLDDPNYAYKNGDDYQSLIKDTLFEQVAGTKKE